MGVEDVLAAPRSPWQNAYAERLIGSIRRECLDHVIVVNERGLRRVLQAYVSLDKDCPSHDRSRRQPKARSWPFRS